MKQSSPKNLPVILSGIQPSGTLHLGNYLGAIKQWVDLQENYKEYIAIVDLHAITVSQDPKTLHKNTLEIAALLIACGIDPKRSTLFVQSYVPAHAELAWILNTITPIGELERMTQYKDKSQRIKDKSGALAGLLTYPVLQAADILLYKTDVVPIGEDQLQHLELTRSIARRFNSRFGQVFKEPRALVQKETSRIMGLDDPTKKMSKSASSANNYISLLDSPEEIRRKMKIAVTDSGKEITYDPAAKPAISNLMAVYSALTGMAYEKIEKKYHGAGYAEFKKDLAEIIVKYLLPIQEKYQTIRKNHASLIKILRNGAELAQAVAQKTLDEVKMKMGFLK